METEKSNTGKSPAKKAAAKPGEKSPPAGSDSPKKAGEKPAEKKPSAAPANKPGMGQVFRPGTGWVEVPLDSKEYKQARAFGRAR